MKRIGLCAVLLTFACILASCNNGSDLSFGTPSDGDAVDTSPDGDGSETVEAIDLKGTSYGGGNAREILMTFAELAGRGPLAWNKLVLNVKGVKAPEAPSCLRSDTELLRGEQTVYPLDLKAGATPLRLLLPPERDFCLMTVELAEIGLHAEGTWNGETPIVADFDLFGHFFLTPAEGSFLFDDPALDAVIAGLDSSAMIPEEFLAAVPPGEDGVIHLQNEGIATDLWREINLGVIRGLRLYRDTNGDGRLDSDEATPANVVAEPNLCRRLAVEPISVAFDAPVIGGVQERNVTVSNACGATGDAVTIRDGGFLFSDAFSYVLSRTGAGVDWPAALYPGETLDVTLSFESFDNSAEDDTFAFFSDAIEPCAAGQSPEACRVSVSAPAQLCQRLAFSPEIVRFDPPVVGISQTRSLTLSNPCDAGDHAHILSIEFSRLASAEFGLVGATVPMRLYPGDSQVIDVHFAPSDLTTEETSIQIISNVLEQAPTGKFEIPVLVPAPPVACGGLEGATCGAGQWCQFNDGLDCSTPDGLGICQTNAELCGDGVESLLCGFGYAPGEGFDYLEYYNGCQLKLAHACALTFGACPDDGYRCENDAGCNPGGVERPLAACVDGRCQLASCFDGSCGNFRECPTETHTCKMLPGALCESICVPKSYYERGPDDPPVSWEGSHCAIYEDGQIARCENFDVSIQPNSPDWAFYVDYCRNVGGAGEDDWTFEEGPCPPGGPSNESYVLHFVLEADEGEPSTTPGATNIMDVSFYIQSPLGVKCDSDTLSNNSTCVFPGGQGVAAAAGEDDYYLFNPVDGPWTVGVVFEEDCTSWMDLFVEPFCAATEDSAFTLKIYQIVGSAETLLAEHSGVLRDKGEIQSWRFICADGQCF
ncbi:MAG: hypothetical protein C4523_06710 [Myxococcales bacterium]|nr:MAG: hypothetical protein C4523_06710 [Myxococcales bacterium]